MDIEDLFVASKTRVDIAIIGAGVIGCCIARELSKYENLSILVVEQEGDVAQGSSKANSGIVHGGYDSKNGSLKSQMELQGNQLFGPLCQELSVPFQQIGSLVLSFTQRDDEELDRLLKNGTLNGVKGLQLLTREQVLSMEPHVSVGVRGALHCPGAAITNPYLFTIANCENAIQNGVVFQFHTQVVNITPCQPGFVLSTNKGKISCTRVINCAGLDSSRLSLTEFQIRPRKGEYILLNKNQGYLANRVLFQAPTPRYGKGVLVTPTVDGNLLMGPSAMDVLDFTDKETSLQELAYVSWAGRRSVPHVDTRESIRSFAGLRAKSSTGDFVVKEEATKGWFTCGGIDSPGLTSAPALALKMVELLQLTHARKKKNFMARREPYTVDEKSPIVCHCEGIREETVVSSCHRGVKIESTDSIKWRTRCGMGSCQGVRCQSRVAEIIAQECDIPLVQVSKSISKSTPTRVLKTELGRL